MGEKAQIHLTKPNEKDITVFRDIFMRVCLKLEEEIPMNRAELIVAMAEKAGLTQKDAEKALKAFTEVVAAELKEGGKIQLVGFGTFEVSERAAREGRNPRTGETMKIAACKAPKFKAGKALKDAIC